MEARPVSEDRVWECTRCQAKRYHQPNKLPSGWDWVTIYAVTPDKKIPARYDARCPKCLANVPPKPCPPAPRKLPPTEPPNT